MKLSAVALPFSAVWCNAVHLPLSNVLMSAPQESLRAMIFDQNICTSYFTEAQKSISVSDSDLKGLQIS